MPLPRSRTAIVLLTLAGLFLASEIGLRLLTGAESSWNIRLGASKRFDPVTLYRLKSSYPLGRGVTTNENGYIAPMHIAHAKPADARRIVYLGDSVSVLPVGSSYPTFVERKLEAAGVPVETLNAAVPGYSSVQARALFESDLQRYDADWFFVYLGWNDLGQYGPEGKAFKRAQAGYTLNPLQRVLVEIYTLRILIAAGDFWQQRKPATLRALTPAEAALYDGYWPEHYEENLRAILRLAKQRYPNVAIMNLATLTSPEMTPDELRRVHAEKVVHKLHRLVGTYNAVVAKVAAEESVEVIDLFRLFDGPAARAEFTDSCHVNAAGSARIADAVVAAIERRAPGSLRHAAGP
jgi:lysophospholipase L1-like esterase